MFSGIVDHVGTIVNVTKRTDAMHLRIQSQFDTLKLGDSVSVDGVCLTVTEINKQIFSCELSPETLRLCISHAYQENQAVNLELALRLNEHIGGHLVTGHVDQMIVVNDIQPQGEFIEFRFSNISQESQRFLMPKGSVTINGVSLTVNAVDQDSFTVMLIPHTLQCTNLSHLKIGQQVNAEWDYMAKLVARQIGCYLSESEKEKVYEVI